MNKDIIYIPIPDNCPICGGNTNVVSENDSKVLICTNPDCKGKLLGKLTHAVSRDALNIDGLSEATIDRFIGLGWLNSIKDIYHLSDHKDAMKIIEGFGSKSVQKLIDSIEKSRNTSLERFLYSLSISLLGKSASGMIGDSLDYDFNDFIKIMDSTGAEYFRNIPGVGDALITSLNIYYKKNREKVIELSQEFTFETQKSILADIPKTLDGKVFVITGNVEQYPNRDCLKADIESHGGKVSSSVSSKTSYLVNNDVNSTSGKNKKAKELGIPIISENQLISMMK